VDVPSPYKPRHPSQAHARGPFALRAGAAGACSSFAFLTGGRRGGFYPVLKHHRALTACVLRVRFQMPVHRPEETDAFTNVTGTLKKTAHLGAINDSKAVGAATTNAIYGVKHNVEVVGVKFVEKMITIGSNDIIIAPAPGIVNKIKLGGYYCTEKAVYGETVLAAVPNITKTTAVGMNFSTNTGVKMAVQVGPTTLIQTMSKSEVYLSGKNEVVVGNKSSVALGGDKKITLGEEQVAALKKKDMVVAWEALGALIKLN